MRKKCFLCRREASKPDGVSLHKFPKHPIKKKMWLRACKLSNEDDVSNIMICSRHFDSMEVVKRDGPKSRNSLRPDAVPSVGVPKQKVAKDVNLTQLSPTTSTGRRPELDVVTNASPIQSFAESSTFDYTDSTPKRRRFHEPRYIAEISTPDVKTPKRARRILNFVRETDERKSKVIKSLRNKNRQLVKRISSLEQMISHLKKNNMMSTEAGDTLLNMIAGRLRNITSSKIKINGEYTPEIRSFAMTLQFYSTKAYKYVRSHFNNKLPHPSTIRAWYRVVDGSPGFTSEALHAIKVRAEHKTVVINLVIDEMCIRKQLIYCAGQFHGCVDYGSNTSNDSDNPSYATNVLVFMAVALNDNWKVPIGYFLIHSLDSKERANLLTLAFKQLEEINCNVYSITFDGAACNIGMCTHLGANLKYSPNFQPFFKNPITHEICYIFYDFSHMIKLIRNTLGDKKILKTVDGDMICWKFIEDLYSLQQKEGLRVANKLTAQHINYHNSKMNVKLAIQTLSNSVSCSLIFLKNINDRNISTNFKNCQATAAFCKHFNDMGDILNCKNKFSKHEFCIPVNTENLKTLMDQAILFENYINLLTDVNGKKMLYSNRKTGFLGMIICLRNIFPLFEQLKKFGITYLLTYKLSQDYLETFFSAIRSRGGFNNNPNALQFKSAYKRLLVRHELKQYENGNCLFDGLDILHVSSKQTNVKDSIGQYQELTFNVEADHDYDYPFWDLSKFVENIVMYIAGFISYKLNKKIVTCETCKTQLTSANAETMPLLARIKNRGPYITPSSDVITICKAAEKVIRKYQSQLMQKSIKKFLLNKIFNQVGTTFNSKIMSEHILKQDILDNHRSQLCKYVIELYLNTRLHYEAKKFSETNNAIRQKFTKLILFQHQ